MNDTETRLRAALHDLADEVAPAPLLERLQRNHRSAVRRRRLALTAVAAAVIAALVAGTLALQRLDQPSIIEPIVRPPKVFRLAGETVTAPGRAQIAVFSAQQADGVGTVHVHPVGGGETVTLAASDWVANVYSQQLSQDGTRLIRQHSYTGDPRLEIVNLTTGSTSRLGGRRGFCPRLSPDNRVVAVFGTDPGGLIFIDARTGKTLPGGYRGNDDGEECPGIGWSPDGTRLAVGGAGETLVLDSRGRPVLRLPGRSIVNADMSWAPDGESILLYDRDAGRNVVRDIGSGAETVLRMPADGLRPLGWAGTRVVWLVGQPGDQRLVTTDQQGRGPRPWMRLDIGDRPVESVMWSRDLTGRSAERGS